MDRVSNTSAHAVLMSPCLFMSVGLARGDAQMLSLTSRLVIHVSLPTVIQRLCNRSLLNREE